MTQTLLTPTAVTRKALMVLHQKLRFVGSINRQYDDSFAKTGAKIGDSLKIRLPNKFTVTNGATMNTQDLSEESVTLQVSTQKHVAMNFTSAELTLSMDDFSKRIIEPAMAVLAAAVEADALTMRLNVWNQVNNTGSAATFNKLLTGRKKLVDNLTPDGDWTALLNTQDNLDMVDALKGLFNRQETIGKQYKDGVMGHTAGFDFMETTHLSTHTRGDANTAYVCNTSSGITSGTATITLSGGSGTIKQGDVFTIVGVNRVHPETKVDTGELQQFVATADGTTSVSVSPTPITSGAKQNIVINSAGASKTVVIAGTASTNYGQSLLYHPDAFTFATADLEMPRGAHFAARENYDGISLRIWQAGDITNDKFPCRVDILYGFKAIRPEMACRLANN